MERISLKNPSELILDSEKYFFSKFEHLNRQTNFSNLFFSLLLRKLNPNFSLFFIELDELDKPILINKLFISKIDLEGLCRKITEITTAKVEEDFEVNVSGFISMYFEEDIPWKEKEQVINIVEELIGSLYGLYADENKILQVKRNTKKKV